MKWHSKRITKLAKEDFEKAWLETKDLLPKSAERKEPPAGKVRQVALFSLHF